MRQVRTIVNPARWSIGAKISVVLLVITLIPLIAASAYGLQRSQDSLQAAETSKLELLAESTANRLDQLINDNIYAVKQLAGSSATLNLLTDPSDASMSEAVSTYQHALEANPFYEYVYLMNAEGVVVLSRQIEGAPSIQDSNFGDRAYFAQPISGEDHYIDVLVGRTSKRLGFYFSTPVYDENGDIVGVTIIKLIGEAVTNVINDLRFGSSGYAFLIDNDGVIVSHPNAELYYHGLVPLDEETEERVARRFVLNDCGPNNPTVCTVETIDAGGLGRAMLDSTAPDTLLYAYPDDPTQQIAGFAPITSLNWVAGANLPVAEFQAPMQALAQQASITAVIAGLLAVAVGLLVARGIVQPVGKLAAAAREIELDNSFEPADIADVLKQQDEIGNLARIFSGMVAALRARMNELRKIYEISTHLTTSIELDEILPYLASELIDIVPAEGAQISLYEPDNKQMRLRLSSNVNAPTLSVVQLETVYPVEGVFKPLIEQGTSVVIEDVTDRTGTLLDREHWRNLAVRSYIGIPLKVQKKVIGTVELISTRRANFTDDQRRILESITIQAASIIHNAQEVEAREQKLKAQIQQLKIEIDRGKQQVQVAEITETEFFTSLKSKVSDMRRRKSTAKSEDAAASVESETEKPEA